jgi:Zn-dependent peptidase ImmA (M78 family)
MLDYRSVAKRAAEIREKFVSSEDLPIDVELIIEKMGIQVIPLPDLRNQVGIDACTAADVQSIYMDLAYYLDTRMEFRVRFSEAHELGHIVLHKELFDKCRNSRPADVLEWAKMVRTSFDSTILEKEADDFAGCLLVPEGPLRKRVDTCLPLLEDKLRKAGYDLAAFDPDAIRSLLADEIYRDFQVCSRTVEICIRKYRMYPRR